MILAGWRRKIMVLRSAARVALASMGHASRRVVRPGTGQSASERAGVSELLRSDTDELAPSTLERDHAAPVTAGVDPRRLAHPAPARTQDQGKTQTQTQTQTQDETQTRDETQDETQAARILVVDDTAMNRQLACLCLQRRGHLVETVDSGALALAALARQRFDLVLMDCMMPDMDGYQACRALRDLERDSGAAPTPVVALTAAHIDGERERCLAAGMNDYLAKPFTPAGLDALVMRWLARP